MTTTSSVNPSHWNISPVAPDKQKILVDALGINPITAQILINRGMASPEAASRFLEPRLSDLHDPFLLPDMAPAVERLQRAIALLEPITIYGDYDADGVCATTVLLRFLRCVGANVNYYIPHRTDEGYGMHVAAVDQLAEQGTQVIVTVDNGTTAVEPIQRAKDHGIDVIVTDHHEALEMPSAAFAVINPKRPDSEYPFSGLCGAGVALKLVMALRTKLREAQWFAERPEPNLRALLDLVAVATIADIVPLHDENRIICKVGLKQLAKDPQCGLDALMRVAGVDRSAMSSYSVGFQIAPRLNAAGRMDHARCAVELLLCEEPAAAEEAANHLHKLNGKRQSMDAKILAQVEKQLRADATFATRASIVLADSEWPAGIIGIVAGRIASSYRLPTILIGIKDEVGRGSGRTVGTFPLLDAIARCAPVLEAFGGHREAAGVTIRPDQIERFREDFETVAKEILTPQMRERTLQVDAVIEDSAATLELAQELAHLGPFGLGNPEPLLAMHNLAVKRRRIVGTNHLQLRLAGPARSLAAIGFSLGDHPEGEAEALDLVFTPTPNTWNGVTTVQLKLRDMRTAAPNAE